MNAEQYDRIGELYHRALALPVAQRAAFVAEACGGDDDLRGEVESLLAAHDAAGTFIARPAVQVAASLIAVERSSIPQHIGRYEVTAPIAQGGMGEVYRARDPLLGREVALKLPRQRYSAGAAAARQFEHEARAASSLNHPNIITVHEIGEADGQRYIVMELVDGKSLAAMIGQRIAASAFVRIARQIAEALAVAHAAGLIHGDIKPANIMVRDDGYVKVLDFGIARLLSASGPVERSRLSPAAPPATVGTPRYMSPEQLRGDTPAPASDVFACGVVLYELATGRHPFVAQSTPTWWPALGTQHPAPPSRDGAPLAPALERLLLRMLEKDPAARPTARNIARTLAAVEARPFGSIDRRAALPGQRTPFVGRSAELAALASILSTPGVRLISLTGAAGAGKTRLALEVAARIAASFDEVSFVSLAQVAQPASVAAAIAEAHGVAEGSGTLLTALRDHLLGAGRALLLLDNFEHVASAATLVGELLDGCPALTVLVTSRVVLHLYGEQEFQVAPLPVPEADGATPESLLESPSVELFVQRAAATRPDFALTAHNARAVAEICRRLDGLPLAIELAAARVRILSPQELLSRLDRRLDVLNDGPADVPARQRGLRSAIEWSYSLLAPMEQTLFRRLAVFAGGCPLDALEAVCNAEEDLQGDVLGLVAALVDSSLVVPRALPDGRVRYTLLETLREFAREQLEARGEAGATRLAHAAYAVVLAEEGEAIVGPADRDLWLRLCEDEHDNLREALAHLISAGHAEWALRLGTALFRFWEWREHFSEGRHALAAVLALPGAAAPSRLRARALYGAAVLASSQHDHASAMELAREAGDIYRSLGDANGVAIATNACAWQTMELGRDYVAARALFEQSAMLWEQLGDARAANQARSNMAHAAKAEGNRALAQTLFEQVAAASEQRGDIDSLATALNALGDLAATFGDVAGARRYHERSLAHFRRIDDRAWIGRVLSDLANLDLANGEYRNATNLLMRALQALHESGQQRGVARQLEALAWCAGQAARHRDAVRCAGLAAAVRRRIRVPMASAERDKFERALAAARAALSAQEFDSAWRAGQAMTVDDVLLVLGGIDEMTHC